VNGKLAEETILSQFASISSGDLDKLMDMYDTFNFCSNMTSKKIFLVIKLCEKWLWFTGGMDACDKASRLLKCGKDNSPEAVEGLMKQLENSIAVNLKNPNYKMIPFWPKLG